jgi:hypothetical protein
VGVNGIRIELKNEKGSKRKDKYIKEVENEKGWEKIKKIE